MPRDAEIILRCITECQAAPTGHGRRWAVVRCRSALEAAGASPALAERLASAARNVAEAMLARLPRLDAR